MFCSVRADRASENFVFVAQQQRAQSVWFAQYVPFTPRSMGPVRLLCLQRLDDLLLTRAQVDGRVERSTGVGAIW